MLGVELVLSYLSLRSVAVRRLLCGKPIIIVENGRILQQNLRQTNVTLDELTSHLRQKDVLDIRQVQYVILETDGNFSVFPYPGSKPASANEAGITPSRQYLPITIIADGYLYKENLPAVQKDENWVRKILKEKNATISSTLLLTVDSSDQLIFFPKEVAQ